MLGLGLALFLAGCASAPRQSATPAPEPYMRIVRADPGKVSLQIALRRFRPVRGHGPEIWLVGASHVGDSNYYATLQRYLDQPDVVLFEGVGANTKGPRVSPEEESSLQHTMAGALGLLFQLEAVDYDRAHFRNSDLTIPQLERLLAGARHDGDGGESEAGQEFQQLLGMMNGSSTLGILMQFGLKLIGSSPKLQAMTKLLLIEALGAFRGDMAKMKGVPPSIQKLLMVIIQERNKVVLADLATELAARKKGSIAVFYGAGHMADLEQRLRTDLKYHPSSETWLTAVGVDLNQAGVSDAEVDSLRSIVRWQMEALQGGP
ncbi:MAG TPA: hypothetical protein VNM37_15685 [Candidatus Dormibacteraeota bacterium]|nr:hypothetical protein [Candidatus Dormibacteraeota bacterium]